MGRQRGIARPPRLVCHTLPSRSQSSSGVLYQPVPPYVSAEDDRTALQHLSLHANVRDILPDSIDLDLRFDENQADSGTLELAKVARANVDLATEWVQVGRSSAVHLKTSLCEPVLVHN